MAGEIEGDVKKTLLDRTDAEKVFRPWWDTVEDYLLNILIGLGGYLLQYRVNTTSSTTKVVVEAQCVLSF